MFSLVEYTCVMLACYIPWYVYIYGGCIWSGGICSGAGVGVDLNGRLVCIVIYVGKAVYGVVKFMVGVVR